MTHNTCQRHSNRQYHNRAHTQQTFATRGPHTAGSARQRNAPLGELCGPGCRAAHAAGRVPPHRARCALCFPFYLHGVRPRALRVRQEYQQLPRVHFSLGRLLLAARRAAQAPLHVLAAPPVLLRAKRLEQPRRAPRAVAPASHAGAQKARSQKPSSLPVAPRARAAACSAAAPDAPVSREVAMADAMKRLRGAYRLQRCKRAHDARALSERGVACWVSRALIAAAAAWHDAPSNSVGAASVCMGLAMRGAARAAAARRRLMSEQKRLTFCLVCSSTTHSADQSRDARLAPHSIGAGGG